MKVCNRCQESKPLTDFNWKKLNESRQSMCRECFKEYRKTIYRNDNGRTKERVRQYNFRKRQENRKFVLQYLLTQSCIDCGENDPVVLEFDHLKDKKAAISKLIHCSGIKQIAEEIQKCVVRCANCHNRKTAKEQGWYKLLNKSD